MTAISPDATTLHATAEAATDDGLGVVDELLRDRRSFLDRVEAPSDPRALARTLVLAIVVASAVFGVALGLYRGGLQTLYAGVKMPLTILLTAGLCCPAVAGLVAVARGEVVALHREVTLVLGTLAVASLALAGLTPILLLGLALDVSYHRLALLATACCAVAGSLGLVFLFRGLRRRLEGRGHRLVGVIAVLVFALTGAQMSWTLRPWLVRPRAPDVTFVRALEGSFFEAVSGSVDSARGRYDRPYAPLPAETGRAWTGEEGP